MTPSTQALSAIAWLALCAAAMAGPDLTPKFSTKTGAVRVTNVGDADAAASWVTVSCAASGGGSCPDPAPADAAPYLQAAFPDRIAIAVPELSAGQKSTHVMAFYDALVFAPGSYAFTVCADAGADVDETKERNNCAVVKMTVRGILKGGGAFAAQP